MTRPKFARMYVPASPEPSRMSDALKQALGSLGAQPGVRIASADLIREMFARDLLEHTAGGGVRFTAEGRRLFREVRGVSDDPLRESQSDVLPPDVQPGN